MSRATQTTKIGQDTVTWDVELDTGDIRYRGAMLYPEVWRKIVEEF